MTVSSTVGFAETGVLIVDKEVISYSHKTSTAFLGLRRYAAYPQDVVCFELGSWLARDIVQALCCAPWSELCGECWHHADHIGSLRCFAVRAT